MRKRRIFAVIFPASCLGLVSCMGEIPVIGVDQAGKTIETMVSSEKYQEELTRGLSDIQESVIPETNKVPGKRQTHLRFIRVGMGVAGSVGLGEYVKIGGNLGFLLVFANK